MLTHDDELGEKDRNRHRKVSSFSKTVSEWMLLLFVLFVYLFISFLSVFFCWFIHLFFCLSVSAYLSIILFLFVF